MRTGSGHPGGEPCPRPMRDHADPPRAVGRLTSGLALPAALLLAPSLAGGAARAEGQVQLSCAGTLLETRGQAERRRATVTLRASLSLEAEAATADLALDLLQQRLAAVRSALQQLEVRELRVTSPSTWQRPGEGKRPAAVQASLQVSGLLAPGRLQALIRTVGALPGVRLEMLRQAYDDARRQAQPLADLIGRRQLRALEIRVDGMDLPMPMLRSMAADAAPPPFNPAELNQPLDRLGMQVRFCAE